MSKAKTILVGAVLTAAAATPIIIQNQANARLKAQIEALHSQLAAAQAQPTGVAGDNGEMEQLRRDNVELLRLRGELTALRERAASKGNQNDEEDRLRGAKLANEQAEGKLC